MQSFQGRFEPTRFEDLTVTVDFHCHSACRFCIVQEGMNQYRGVPFERFKRAVDENAQNPRYRRVTFTGGEITLEKRLFDYLDYAREHGHFEHIRLQTDARLLRDRSFAERLIAAGGDEFFVSLHGQNPEVHDYITQRPGSFEQTWQGLLNLRSLGATILTNTVLTQLNVDHLTEIVRRASELAPATMEWWNYLPMQDKSDSRELIVPMAELAPALTSALDEARRRSIRCAVKYVPICLLGAHKDCIDNAQPDVVIVEEFYDLYPKFACLYEAKCEYAEPCLALTFAYISKHGWEEQLLVAEPRERPWSEPEDGLAYATERPVPSAAHRPALEHPRWRELVDGVAESLDAKLGSVVLDRRRCTYRFVIPGGRVDLVLTTRTRDRQALLRSASFDIWYRSVRVAPDAADPERVRAQLSRVVEAAARAVAARDRGQMLLDERKGLIGEEALRRKLPKRSGPDSSV